MLLKDIFHFAVLFFSLGALVVSSILHFLLYKSLKDKTYRIYSFYLIACSLYPLVWLLIAFSKQPLFPWGFHVLDSPFYKLSEISQVFIFIIYYYFIKIVLGFNKWQNKLPFIIYKIGIVYHLIYFIVLVINLLLDFENFPRFQLLLASRIYLLAAGVVFWIIVFRMKLTTFQKQIGYGSITIIFFGLLSLVSIISSKIPLLSLIPLSGADYLFIGFVIDSIFFGSAISIKYKQKTDEITKVLLENINLEKKLALEKVETQNKVLQSQLDERNRIAKDLHDDIGADLSKIKSISSKAFLNNLQQMDKIKELSNEAVEKLNDIIWSMNNIEMNIEELAYFIRSKCANMVMDAEIKFNSCLDEDFPNLTLDALICRNVFLLCKEATNNALKYSKANTIELEIRCYENTLELKVSDDGIGINDKSIKGNGLKNFELRTATLNGSFDINSKPNSGTKVIFKIPI